MCVCRCVVCKSEMIEQYSTVHFESFLTFIVTSSNVYTFLQQLFHHELVHHLHSCHEGGDTAIRLEVEVCFWVIQDNLQQQQAGHVTSM